MPKSKIHPKWFDKTVIFCEGKPLCIVGSTKSTLNVDVWLATHPFYTQGQTILDSESTLVISFGCTFVDTNHNTLDGKLKV